MAVHDAIAVVVSCGDSAATYTALARGARCSLWLGWKMDLEDAGNDSSDEFDSPAHWSLASAGWRRSFSTPAKDCEIAGRLDWA